MITKIAIENFKGVRERVSLDFRPITLLFGANSAGKSTILHALHYAREVFERHNLDADNTIAGGKYIDLGGYKRLVHRSENNGIASAPMPIRLRIDVDVSHDELKSFDSDIDGLLERSIARTEQYSDDVQATFDDISWLLDYSFDTLFNRFATIAIELEIAWSATHECPYIARNTIYIDDEPFIQLEANPQLRGVAALMSFTLPPPQEGGATIEVATLNHKCL